MAHLCHTPTRPLREEEGTLAPPPSHPDESKGHYLLPSGPPHRGVLRDTYFTWLQPHVLEEQTPSFSHLEEEAQLTLNVCFRLMLSEGCTAATRKLNRGMLPRTLSCFSSVGEIGVQKCARACIHACAPTHACPCPHVRGILMLKEGQGALQPY